MSSSLAAAPPLHAAFSPIVCNRCEYALPLRLAGAGEQATVWLCVECGLPYAAMCIPSRLRQLSERVALDDRYFDTSYLPPIAPDTRAEIARLSFQHDQAYDFKERRRSARRPVALPAAAVELDHDLNPISPTFQMMVVNVSTEGIGLVTKGLITAPYLAAKLRSSYRAEAIQVVIQIRRQETLRPPFNVIGGEFVVRLGSRGR
ncbi:MAG: hypothetical protein KF847_16680 [Pirellulales bacterium]|nr:hypothetical protein [Pirellulales bacterium]